MKRKALAILLCLAMVLTVALPGTLAVSADEVGGESLLPCTCGAEDGNHAESCPLYVQPKQPEEKPVCTCGSEDDTHAEDCPLYTAPEEAKPGENPVCTCGAEDDNHAEDCPLYTQSEVVEEKPEGELPVEQEPYSPITGVQSFLDVAPLMNMQSLMTLDDYGRAGNDNGDVFLNKTAKTNTDGSFTITLEAYATGASHTESHYDPADIVLVLDVSNSMRNSISSTNTYKAVYGRSSTNDKNKDGQGNTSYTNFTDKNGITSSVNRFDCTNAYSVEGHDASSYVSNNWTYYAEINGTIQKVYYTEPNAYPSNDYQNVSQNYGWYYYNNGFKGPIVPKTDENDRTLNSYQFYIIDPETTRLASLKAAAIKFIENVFTQQVEGGDNSIAIVSYASEANVETNFINDKSALTLAITKMEMDPKNGTRTDLALNKAKQLLNDLNDEHNGHNKVVVLFTDGEPSIQYYKKDSYFGDIVDGNPVLFGTIANNAIQTANEIKGGATLYTIGMFSGANGAISSYDSTVNSNSTDTPRTTNTFLHLVSSNFPNSNSLSDHGSQKEDLNGKSYYLSAGNAEQLMTIFQQISQEVGGANNTTLDKETVIKDIIDPSFTVPANTSDVKIYTADCTGAGLTFGTRTEVTSGITTTITGDTLDVKGFDFSANWCGDHSGTYGGKKLIIEFTVKPKDGFLGGNNVVTNGANSGMYSDGECIGYFPVPEANVAIKNNGATITSNVYLGGYYGQTLTGEKIKANTKITIGGVELDLSQKDYGLEDWQTGYVDIVVTITGKDGKEYTNSELKDDLEYTVTVTIKPKEAANDTAVGTPNDTSGKDSKLTGTVHVFKPELTYKDSEVWYGNDAPKSYGGNLTQTRWVHYGADEQVDKVANENGVTMVENTAPSLTITYVPETDKIVDSKIATKQDIAVDVTVKIDKWNVTDYTTFLHTDCTGKTCGTPTNGKFWLHVNTCQLTITKTGGAENESYVFDVLKDGKKYTEITIWGNGSETIYELPVGNYTIQENTGWSWRYTPSYQYGNNDTDTNVELNSTNTIGTITCTNSSSFDKWLNGFSTIVQNIYGKTDSQIKK